MAFQLGLSAEAEPTFLSITQAESDAITKAMYVIVAVAESRPAGRGEISIGRFVVTFEVVPERRIVLIANIRTNGS